MNPVLVDTGFLVALFDPTDGLSRAATVYVRDHAHPLATTSAAVVEVCFFLGTSQKAEFLGWLRRGAVSVHDVPVSAYAAMEGVLRRYADQEIDFADAAMVWLSGKLGIRRILTADTTHFSLFRLGGGKRFELVDWN